MRKTAWPRPRQARLVDTERLARYRRAADYLAAEMIFLRGEVLLTEPLRAEHLKPRPLGHWGTCPGTEGVSVPILLVQPREEIQIARDTTNALTW